MIFYRTSSDVYEMVRSGLDQAWGHPLYARHEPSATDVYTLSCLPPVADAVTDNEGRVYVALNEEMAEWPEVGPQIEMLLHAGMLEEITEQQYRAAKPPIIMP